MSWTLCIDFGTTNTAAAFIEDTAATPVVVQLGADGDVMASGVFAESPEALLAGDTAVEAAAGKPAAYMPTPKRAVGYPVITINGYDLDPDVVVATVIREVLDRGVDAHAAATGDTSKPAQLVLTHPADWSPQQIRVLFDAAGWLGFDHAQVRTVPEPQAVMLGAVGTNPVAPGTKFAVFDLGAGSVSVSVLTANPSGTFDVLASGADPTVGGANFDGIIRRWVDGHLQQQYPGVLEQLRQSANPSDLRHLEQSITDAKEALSVQPSAVVHVPGGVRLELRRQEFEALIHADLVKAATLFTGTLAQAGTTSHDLHALYLTGGSARIPAVRQMLAPMAPPVVTEQSRTAIAVGALMAAARGQASGYPAEPPHPGMTGVAGSVPAADKSSGKRRWVWIGGAAAGVAAVLAIGGGVMVMTGGSDAPAATASTAGDPEADAAAASDLIERYVETADTGGPDELNPMRCADKQWVVDADHPLNPPGFENTVENVGTVSITGDTATARVRYVEAFNGDEKTRTYVFGLVREADGWKVCSFRPQ
ncbi:MAG: Hsp70 family protein [Rhodococcus sp.]|nr:Hsp70 family protein [Rhodococcus sp. (in: high G+C Gram-positive bacteria)]